MKTMKARIRTIKETIDKKISDAEKRQEEEFGSSASKRMEEGGQGEEPSPQELDAQLNDLPDSPAVYQ